MDARQIDDVCLHPERRTKGGTNLNKQELRKWKMFGSSKEGWERDGTCAPAHAVGSFLREEVDRDVKSQTGQRGGLRRRIEGSVVSKRKKETGK